jgi:hypothetical protein
VGIHSEISAIGPPFGDRRHVTTFDIQCATALKSAPKPARCQLLAGHVGPHAVMFSRGSERIVRCWRDGDPANTDDHPAGHETMPWVRGCPLPAWYEGSPRGSIRQEPA